MEPQQGFAILENNTEVKRFSFLDCFQNDHELSIALCLRPSCLRQNQLSVAAQRHVKGSEELQWGKWGSFGLVSCSV